MKTFRVLYKVPGHVQKFFVLLSFSSMDFLNQLF
jgi:hypothetical protein